MKTRIAQAIKIFGIMAMVASFAAAAFPTRSFAAENTGTLTVNVYKASSNLSAVALQPLDNASVEVFDVNGAKVADVATNSAGSASLELAKGTYKVRASATGYTSATGSVVVNAGGDVAIKFELRPSAPRTGSGK